LHLLRFSVDNFEGAVAELEKRGAPVSMQGESMQKIEGLRYAYFDTEDILDYIIEIFNDEEDLTGKKQA